MTEQERPARDWARAAAWLAGVLVVPLLILAVVAIRDQAEPTAPNSAAPAASAAEALSARVAEAACRVKITDEFYRLADGQVGFGRSGLTHVFLEDAGSINDSRSFSARVEYFVLVGGNAGPSQYLTMSCMVVGTDESHTTTVSYPR